MLYQTIIVYEHRTEKAHIITMNINNESDEALDVRLQTIKEELNEQITIPDPETFPITFKPQISEATFIENVKKAQHYIEKGEAAQIVLSQKMEADITGDPFTIYRELRTSNPSPYMFYIDFSDYLIIGASPESLVQTTDNQVVTNPIAGTRPRGTTIAEDEALQQELLADKKETNEHDMLVELSKEDLSLICDTDSIHVPVYQDVVKYEHVMHIVSEVYGTLKENSSSIDALIACLPAGTVSGSLKFVPCKLLMKSKQNVEDFTLGE